MKDDSASGASIARIKAVDVNELDIVWIYKQQDVRHRDPYQKLRCPNEVFISTHVQKIELETILDFATVIRHSSNICGKTESKDHWCWTQYYNPITGSFSGSRDLRTCKGAPLPSPQKACPESLNESSTAENKANNPKIILRIQLRPSKDGQCKGNGQMTRDTNLKSTRSEGLEAEAVEKKRKGGGKLALKHSRGRLPASKKRRNVTTDDDEVDVVPIDEDVDVESARHQEAQEGCRGRTAS